MGKTKGTKNEAPKASNANIRIVNVPKGTVYDYCKEPLTDEDYLNEECLKCGETVEQTAR